MTAYSGTIDIAGKGGELGKQLQATGHYALAGALVNADTIKFANLLPAAGSKVVSLMVVYPELDTDASPTGTWTVGNSDSAAGYCGTQNLGLPVQAPVNTLQIINIGTGALIGTTVTNRDVIITITGVMATSATTGTIGIIATLEGVAA